MIFNIGKNEVIRSMKWDNVYATNQPNYLINVNQELNMNNNKKMSVEIRRISMWITPCKRSATRGMKPSISSELRRSSIT